jgi:DNA-binding GntR family transcriptional regulator
MARLREPKITVRDHIKSDILHGRWVPGERLAPAALASVYAISTTVVREALTRLTGEGFVRLEPNRGFFVPELSLTVLRDLTEVRCRSEALAIELAIARGGLGWESRLVAAHHELAHTPRRRSDDHTQYSDDWARAHAKFHLTLIEGCQVPVLISLTSQLADSTEFYRRWSAPSPAASRRDVESEHSRILEAVLAGRASLASALLRDHYERTVQIVLDSGLLKGVSNSDQTDNG